MAHLRGFLAAAGEAARGLRLPPADPEPMFREPGASAEIRIPGMAPLPAPWLTGAAFPSAKPAVCLLSPGRPPARHFAPSSVPVTWSLTPSTLPAIIGFGK